MLVRRLKNYYKRQKNAKVKKKAECDISQERDYFVIIDFEGTCEKENAIGYVHEIIEFPAVLVNARTLELVGCVAHSDFTYCWICGDKPWFIFEMWFMLTGGWIS